MLDEASGKLVVWVTGNRKPVVRLAYWVLPAWKGTETGTDVLQVGDLCDGGNPLA